MRVKEKEMPLGCNVLCRLMLQAPIGISNFGLSLGPFVPCTQPSLSDSPSTYILPKHKINQIETNIAAELHSKYDLKILVPLNGRSVLTCTMILSTPHSTFGLSIAIFPISYPSTVS